ncbi:hypothetical protein ACWEO4_21100 [Streptomyces sp. NPDC004393]|uniref:hypothetical protein n=1 Tax=Streptomyces sp. NPDC004533 TaxID=3154278 RepID=UPI0033B88A21
MVTWDDQHLMLDAANRDITHYDPNGWDHGAGWKGPAAHSLPDLAVLLGMIAESSNALESADDAVRAAPTRIRSPPVPRSTSRT